MPASPPPRSPNAIEDAEILPPAAVRTLPVRRGASPLRPRPLRFVSKVAEISATFWLIKLPHLVATGAFASALALIFVLWYASEKTLSVHRISRGRRELFYWATVM